MDEYIKREAAVQALQAEADKLKVGEGDALAGLYTANCILDDLPAADVAPVRHGRWYNKTENLPDPAGFGLIPVRNVWRCSQCGCPIINETEDPDRLFKYCPNCGAKMDGKETEE